MYQFIKNHFAKMQKFIVVLLYVVVAINISLLVACSDTKPSPAETVDWLYLRPSQFRERINKMPVAYLPLGTLEWHGEHLPLGADALQPLELFREIATEIGGIVLPPLFLGPDTMLYKNGEMYVGMEIVSEDGKGNRLPLQKLDGGAYWQPKPLFIQTVEQILFNLQRMGIRLLVAHGHGPSTVAVLQNRDEWERKYGIKIIHLWKNNDSDIIPDGLGFQVDHAATNETSIVWRYFPQYVDMSALPADLQTWPIGVGGRDPRVHASQEHGKAITEFNKERVINMIKQFMNGI
jgi:creatinine amidohydrolase